MASRIVIAALLTAVSASPALAQEGGGAVACLQDARNLQAFLQQNRDKLSPERQRDAQQRLSVANDQCRSEPLLGQTNITALRNSLRKEVQQQATLPEQGYNPAGD